MNDYYFVHVNPDREKIFLHTDAHIFKHRGMCHMPIQKFGNVVLGESRE